MNGVADYDDPGWRAAVRGIGWFVVPIVHLWTWKRRAEEDGLTALRRVFLGVVDSLFLFVVSLAYIVPWNSGHAGVAALLIALLGTANLLMIFLLNRRPLPGGTPERLAGGYKARLFVGIGYAAATALFAFCGSLITQSLWIYLMGLAFSVISFAILAPTKANIERGQQSVQRTGSPLFLGQALLDERSSASVARIIDSWRDRRRPPPGRN